MSGGTIPVAAGEPARQMIRAWAEGHGMTLLQGRPGEKYPVVEWRGMDAGEYRPWDGTGPGIAQIGRYMAILDADDEQARELVASWDLPEHFATRGVSYGKGVITEHHYFSNFEGLERLLGMCPGLDLLANPHGQELWVKVYDTGYEVLSAQPGKVPELPGHVVALYRAETEERRQRSAADGEVPVERYRAEGIEYGQQNPGLYRSACSLAARRAQPDEILAVLTEIVGHSQTDPSRPWREDQLATMADRAYRRYGKPPVVVEQMEMEDPDPALYPADEDQEPEPAEEPEQEQEDLSRHVTAPRLRVAPPAELAGWADSVIKGVLAQIWKITYPARPANHRAEDAQWGDMNAAMVAVRPAAEVLGWIGDLDLIDYQRASAIIHSAVLPVEYTDTMGETDRDGLDRVFTEYFLAGWNKGATDGHDVPAELQAALDAWHPPCPIPREDIEAHRLPGREGRWPVQNHVAMIDDRGSARRLLDHYGSRILFVDGQKGLGEYAFDDQRWLDVDSGGPGLVAEFADQMIQILPVTEAMSLSVAVSRFDKDGNPVSDRGRYWTWLNMQQSNARREGMIAGAVAIPGMRVPVSVFDAETRWLNAPGGEIDLGWAEVDAAGTWSVGQPPVHHPGRHYPEHRHTRITAAPYDPLAICPAWEQALKAWLADDAMITYLGKLVAASVRGLVTLKVIPLLLGEGNSGKSTFLETLMAVLGGYATTAQPTILRKGKGGTLTDDLADLRGFRFVTTTETAGTEQMDEPKLKRLSGGDRQRARGLFRSSAEFDAQFLLWLATNSCPRLSGEDLALWNRFGPVEFPGMFTETGLAPDGTRCQCADPNLKTALMAEAPGILAWVIRHLELLYCEGLREPAAVTAKRHELRGQQDTPGQFIAELMAAGPGVGEEAGLGDPLLIADPSDHGLQLRFTRVYQHYRFWAKDKFNPVGKDSFRAALKNHRFKVTRPQNIETVGGFGHRKGPAAQCPVCEEKLSR